MPSLYETLRADLIVTMKARDSFATTALRTADAGIKKAAMDTNKEIDDALVIQTLRKTVKNLSDANIEFDKAGRTDLSSAYRAEILLLEKYLPKAFDSAMLDQLVDKAITESGAQSKKDMGKAMGLLKKSPEAGLLDFSEVSKRLQARLP